SGADFVAASGTAAFGVGQTSATVTVDILGDTAAEPDETFEVRLTNPSGLTVGDGVGVVTILDDDDPAPSLPVITIDGTWLETDKGKTWVSFDVVRSGDLSGSSSATFTTSGGTATTGSDYDWSSQTVTFAPGQSIATISIRMKGDKFVEGDETILFDVTGVSGATIGTTVVTIIDDANGLVAASASTGPMRGVLLDHDTAGRALAVVTAAWASEGMGVAALDSLTIEIVDLPGLQLGFGHGSTIVLDVDAAGWGWSVGGEAHTGAIDLVSVMMHETGHVLGFAHGDGAMAAVIDAGQRLEQNAVRADIGAVFAPVAVETVTSNVESPLPVQRVLPAVAEVPVLAPTVAVVSETLRAPLHAAEAAQGGSGAILLVAIEAAPDAMSTLQGALAAPSRSNPTMPVVPALLLLAVLVPSRRRRPALGPR
ncbi:MAG: matrixin family metalloprotease, partial [Ilumatobacter sp.]|nr:matrixin family metalloprotease [Ilumatobacter sp.]